MVGRLLWKEAREGWLVLLIALALPPVGPRIASRFATSATNLASFMCYFCFLASAAVVMEWGRRKGSRRRTPSQSPLAHLPANPMIENLITVLLPLAVSALVGLWIGRFITPYAHPFESTNVYALALSLSAYYLVAGFAGCYLIAATASSWAALLAGFVWGIVGLSWLPQFEGGQWIHSMPAWTQFLGRSAAGAGLCLLLLLLLRRRQPRFVSAAAIGLLAVVLFAPFLVQQIDESRHPDYFGDTIYSADRSLELSVSDERVLTYTDRRTGRSAEDGYRGYSGLIGFDKSGFGYIIRQDAGSERASIVRWNGKSSRVLATIPAIPQAIAKSGHACHGSISPDGRYVAFALACALGKGIDLWIIDSGAGVGWVAFANQSYGDMGSGRWLGHRFVLPDYDTVLTVDLRNHKTGTLKIPVGDRG